MAFLEKEEDFEVDGISMPRLWKLVSLLTTTASLDKEMVMMALEIVARQTAETVLVSALSCADAIEAVEAATTDEGVADGERALVPNEEEGEWMFVLGMSKRGK